MAVAAYGEGRLPISAIPILETGARSRGPFNFLENNPIQSSFWVRFMLQDKEKLASPSNCKHPGSSCPQQPP